MRKILLIVWLVLLVYRPALANPVLITGIGEVDLGRDIIVTEGRNDKGELNYSFKIKDGKVWRGAILLPIKSVDNNNISLVKMDALLNKIVEEKIRNDSSNVLETENAMKLMLGGRECTTTSIKITSLGFIANFDIIIIPGKDNLKMLGFICADSDAQYWRPIMQKIASQIP